MRLYPRPLAAGLAPRPSFEEIDEVEPTMMGVIYCQSQADRYVFG